MEEKAEEEEVGAREQADEDGPQVGQARHRRRGEQEAGGEEARAQLRYPELDSDKG